MTELPETCDAALLTLLTGVTETHLRRLGKSNVIPNPEQGQWPTVKTLQALYNHWRGKGEEKTSLGQEKLMKAVADRRIAEAEAARLEHQTLSRRGVEQAWDFMLQAARARWIQLPPKAALAFPTWVDARACGAWTEQQICELLDEFSRSPDYNLKEKPEAAAVTAPET
jgi:hypothetical protein